MRSSRDETRTRGSAAVPRPATATVEFAVCLPLMLLITFGSIEAANSIYLKQIVTQAAYEGARVATTIGATQEDASTFVQAVLDSRNLQGTTVSFNPTIDALTPPGTEVTVTVIVPANANAFAPQWFYRDREIQARVVMIRN